MLGFSDIIAMTPDVRKFIEVGCMILLTFRVTPETDGHTGERISTGQFTFLTRLQNVA